MAIEHHFYVDTTASRHELREVLMRANLGFEVNEEDWKAASGGMGSGAVNQATLISILDGLSPMFSNRPEVGVTPTRSIGFRDRRTDSNRFHRDTTLSILALLRAYPEADAFWEGVGGEPMLLRRHGRLVLSEAKTKPELFWDPKGQPYRALVDLPYRVEPLGPWWT